MTFPTYYAADLGESVLCGLHDKDGELVEAVFCEVSWDWGLKIWGPKNTIVTNTEEYTIQVNGVVMNDP